MSPSQGFFECDDDYRARVAKEADESTIKHSTGSAPSQGFFESDDSYRDRITREANEHRIESSSGSAPSQGIFETDDGYRDRIEWEANESTITSSTGARPSQGFFESDESYVARVRKEANEQVVARGTRSSRAQGFFEGDHAYRSRIAHEAREVRADGQSMFSGTSNSTTSPDYRGAGSYVPASGRTSSGSSGGIFVAIAVVIAIAVGMFSNSAQYATDQTTPSAVVVTTGECPFEGCQLGTWIARSTIPVYKSPGGKIVRMLGQGESVHAVSAEVRSLPRKALITKTYKSDEEQGLYVGSLAYVLHPIGEGAVALWSNGRIIRGSLDLELRYTESDEPRSPQWTWWVRVRLSDDALGWLQNPQGQLGGMDRYE